MAASRVSIHKFRYIYALRFMCIVVYREIETAVPDERILVLFVRYILLKRSYNIKVNIFGLNEVKIEIENFQGPLCVHV